MEALAASNYKSVLPAYFETALKMKYSRDEDSARMFDLIHSVMTLDFGYIYNNAIGTPLSVVSTGFKNENMASSAVAANRERLNNELASYLEKVKTNNP